MIIKRLFRAVLPYVFAAIFLAAAILGAKHGVYWLCIAGLLGAGCMIIYIIATTKTGPVTLDVYKDQQIMVDRNKID